MDKIKYGKHKGKTLLEVIEIDPNYALHAHANYNWFPKLTREQIADCSSRYRYKWGPNSIRDWSTYDMADYGDGWV